MSYTVYVAIFGWFPAVLLFFAVLPPRQAVVVSYTASWLFLPVVNFHVPGLPDVTKTSITSMSVLLGMILFDARRLLSQRPRWFDLPVAVWCACPFAASIANGLGAYDGLSISLGQTMSWGLPYLIGRAYFDDLGGARALAVGVLMGALVYVPLCLWEIRFSPQLHRIAYGFATSAFGMTVRYNGYRPQVFMQHGLELGMWMTAGSLTGIGFWWAGALKQVRGVPFGPLLLGLLVTTVLCKSTGALVLLACGVVILAAIGVSKRSLPVWLLIAVAPGYELGRMTGALSTRSLMSYAASAFDEDRTQSLGFRLDNEDMLRDKALQSPVFGWGGWGRARIYNAEGKDVTITDGYWIIALGNMGALGLSAFTATVLLPLALLPGRFPVRTWLTPAVVPAAVLGILLGLYMIDNLGNAMYNPIYVLAVGGLTALRPARSRRGPYQDEPATVATRVVGALRPRESTAARQGAMAERRALEGHPEDAERLWRRALALWLGLVEQAPGDVGCRHGLASECERFGRFLGRYDRAHEAYEFRERAVEVRAGLARQFPDDPEAVALWLDSLNDLAWLLVAAPDADPIDVARALGLADAAARHDPSCATYWNTLGVASYRNGDWQDAIAALERAAGLADGGTGFDFVFLAMSCWQQGERERAHAWYQHAERWRADHAPDHAELLRACAEAGALLGAHNNVASDLLAPGPYQGH